jgi:hypothetical protein
MDFALAFSFPFQDEEWVKKIAIAAVLCLTIIGTIPVFGWSLVVTKRVISGETPVLPDWSNFGEYIMLAIKGIVVAIVFSLPIIVITVPVSVATTLVDSNDLATVIAIVNVCLSCVSLVYGILMAFALPAAYGQLAATDSIGSALNVGKLLGMIRAAPSAYLIAVLGYLVAGFVGSLGVVLCVIGVFATTAYSMVVEGHLYGQAYKAAVAAGAA